MFDVGLPELVLILVVALVVFGPGKLPEVGASIGKAIREFRRATQSVTAEIESVTKLETEDEMRTRLITEQNRKREAAAAAVAQETSAPAAVMPPLEIPTPAVQEPIDPALSAAPAAPVSDAETTTTLEPAASVENPAPVS